MSTRVGLAIQDKLEKAGHEVSLVDPGTLDLPILQTPLHWYPGMLVINYEINLVDLATLELPMLQTPLHWYPGMLVE